MAITIHRISRYTIQVLTKKVGENAHSYVTLRLYDEDDVNRGVVVFENYGADEPPKPTGDHEAQTARAYLDIAHYRVYMDILRLEKVVYLKIGWTQQGPGMAVAQMSIDTKKEVIGEFFES